jgi:hypothetical protein
MNKHPLAIESICSNNTNNNSTSNQISNINKQYTIQKNVAYKPVLPSETNSRRLSESQGRSEIKIGHGHEIHDAAALVMPEEAESTINYLKM